MEKTILNSEDYNAIKEIVAEQLYSSLTSEFMKIIGGPITDTVGNVAISIERNVKANLVNEVNNVGKRIVPEINNISKEILKSVAPFGTEISKELDSLRNLEKIRELYNTTTSIIDHETLVSLLNYNGSNSNIEPLSQKSMLDLMGTLQKVIEKHKSEIPAKKRDEINPLFNIIDGAILDVQNNIKNLNAVMKELLGNFYPPISVNSINELLKGILIPSSRNNPKQDYIITKAILEISATWCNLIAGNFSFTEEVLVGVGGAAVVDGKINAGCSVISWAQLIIGIPASLLEIVAKSYEHRISEMD